MDRRRLGGLARIARIKADMELRRFADVRGHVATLDGRIDALRAELIAVAEAGAGPWGDEDAGGPTDAGRQDRLRQTRLAHALTREVAVEREAAVSERAQLSQRFEAARAEAARAFGRAEVLDALSDRLARANRARQG